MPIRHEDDPPPGQRITTLHAWIAIQADGGEGIIAAVMQSDLGVLSVPLVTSKLSLAQRMTAKAVEVQRMAEKDGQPIKIELRTFNLTTTNDT